MDEAAAELEVVVLEVVLEVDDCDVVELDFTVVEVALAVEDGAVPEASP